MEQTKTQFQTSPDESTSLDAEEPARFLQWDSEFFGTRIATVDSPSLSSGQVARLASWCNSKQIQCLYFLAAGDDLKAKRVAEDSGFRMVDIRMTLARPLQNENFPAERIRKVQPSDVSQLKRLAAKSFTNSRFYNDGRFTREKCDELYSTWFERSCEGYADCVLVADVQGRPAGFITCSLERSDGVIGLLAVDKLCQGHGLGRGLVNAALKYFQEHEMIRARVVTQGFNAHSQRLYQHCGFVTDMVQVWYHCWNGETGVPAFCDAQQKVFSPTPA
jgi:ribosomal protein S18 acetylase RimI-like enzyme